MFALRNESSRRVVDENIQRRLAPDGVHHALDGGAVADIAGDRRDLAAGLFAHPARRRLEAIELAAADHELGTEREEAVRHRSTETRTATGDEDSLVLEQACFKHGLNPPCFVVASAAKQSRNRTAEIVWIASLRSQCREDRPSLCPNKET